MKSIKATLDNAIQNGPLPREDVELLLIHVLKKNRSHLYTHPEKILSQQEWGDFTQLLSQRIQGEPVAYLVGQKPFWSFNLKVTPATLIPRPETELLVEYVLHYFSNKKHLNMLDLGTGSGAIALACASENPTWTIDACDVSAAALEVAKENSQQLHLKNVRWIISDWFKALKSQQRYDIITANPPYIAEDDPHLQMGDLRFEPQTALIGGKTGLSSLQYIIENSPLYLKSGGALFLEHGFAQKIPVRSMLNNYGYKELECFKDHSGHDRVSMGRMSIDNKSSKA